MVRPPSTGPVTSPFGPRSLPVPGVGPFHYGEDTIGDGNVSPAAGTIVYAAYHGVFGNIILVRENSSVVWNMAHHAHLNGRRAGQRVIEGEHLAPQGATGLVTGKHVHTERRVGGGNSVQSGTATNPRSYYSTPSGGGGTPIPPARTDEDDEEMNTLWITDGPSTYLATVGPGIFTHLMSEDNPDLIMRIIRGDDTWQKIDISQLAGILKAYGCDARIWDRRFIADQEKSASAPVAGQTDLVVLDPLTGLARRGNVWTAEKASRAAILGIPQKVWGTTVNRDTGKVSALQEIADTKTIAIRIESAGAARLNDEQITALGKQIAAAVKPGATPAEVEDAVKRTLGVTKLIVG